MVLLVGQIGGVQSWDFDRIEAGTLLPGWHLLKISHQGERIRVFLDGDMKLMVDAGDRIPQDGVGLWTKADAATAFDSFTVIPR